MSELKPCPCPICGAELKIYGPEDWRPTFNDPDSGGEPYNAVCDCGFQYSNRSYDYTEFIACLNRRAQPDITGETSDGYHTFNELYHHRAVLFSVICNSRPDIAWKAKRHHDGTMYNGMFIVGINTPDGQATYHYDVEPYWEMFRVPELLQAPEWDGHTPAQAIERIGKLSAQSANEPLTRDYVEEAPATDVTQVVHGRWILLGKNEHNYETSVEEKCSLCGRYVYRYDTELQDIYCPNCGARMDAKEDKQ